ncbi:hypothetical protein ICNMLN_ICNMLN_10630, partial [Dysosmobacter welbionis]
PRSPVRSSLRSSRDTPRPGIWAAGPSRAGRAHSAAACRTPAPRPPPEARSACATESGAASCSRSPPPGRPSTAHAPATGRAFAPDRASAAS